ncbi:MAG: 2Fe-2S iron-sulfur cluster binding domain-containing protein [Bacillota bacterium]|nr:2Fe-2S iron-sulfur cluster binding domain-containing protein [Bacillota bacterium]
MDLQSVLILVSLLVGITLVLIIADFLIGSNQKILLRINKEKEFTISSGGTLLDALSENKIYIPSACGGKGTCGHCKVKVDSGGGEILPTEENFLSLGDKKEGVRLACQVKIREDIIDVSMSEDLLDAQEYIAEVVVLEDLNYDTKFLKLKLLSPNVIEFKPGQYVQILVPGYEEFRAYSIASPPSQKDMLDFVIRYIPKGLCTTYIHKALRIGDVIKITGPYGDFYLQEDSDKDIICLARSTGIAPIRSIVLHLKERGMTRDAHGYYSGRTKKDILLDDEMKALEEKHPNFKYYIVLSRPAPDDNWEGETGYITDAVPRYEESLENKEFYLCGPPEMIDAAMETLKRNGVSEEQIFFDKF